MSRAQRTNAIREYILAQRAAGRKSNAEIGKDLGMDRNSVTRILSKIRRANPLVDFENWEVVQKRLESEASETLFGALAAAKKAKATRDKIAGGNLAVRTLEGTGRLRGDERGSAAKVTNNYFTVNKTYAHLSDEDLDRLIEERAKQIGFSRVCELAGGAREAFSAEGDSGERALLAPASHAN